MSALRFLLGFAVLIISSNFALATSNIRKCGRLRNPNDTVIFQTTISSSRTFIYDWDDYFALKSSSSHQVLNASTCRPIDVRNRTARPVFLGYKVADSRVAEVVRFDFDAPITEEGMKPGMLNLTFKSKVRGNTTIEIFAEESQNGTTSRRRIGGFSFSVEVIEVNVTLMAPLSGPPIPQQGEIGPLKPAGSGVQSAPGLRCDQRLAPNESILFGRTTSYTTGVVKRNSSQIYELAPLVRDASTCQPVNVSERIIDLSYEIEDSRIVRMVKFALNSSGILQTELKYVAPGTTKVKVEAHEIINRKRVRVGGFQTRFILKGNTSEADSELTGLPISQNAKIGPLRPLSSGTQTPNPSPSPSSSPSPSLSSNSLNSRRECFPATAMLETHRGPVAMKDIRVGDKVRVRGNQYSRIYSFTHKSPKARAIFVYASHSSGVFAATRGHFIRVLKNDRTGVQVLPMRELQVGDYLILVDGTKSRVFSLEYAQNEGLYNPHTIDGEISVDGVQATTYTEAVEHSTAHALLAPLRGAYLLRLGWLLKHGFNALEKLID